MKSERKQRAVYPETGSFRQRMLASVIVSAVCLVSAVILYMQRDGEEIVVVRPAPGEISGTEELVVSKDGQKYPVLMEVLAREYSNEEIEALHPLAIAYIEGKMLGENSNWEEVRVDLDLSESFPETGGEIVWSSDTPWLVDIEGHVLNEAITEPVSVCLRAEIYYGSEFRVYERLVTVHPKVYTGEELELLRVQQELESLEEGSRTKDSFSIPMAVLGWSVQNKEDGEFGAEAFLVLLSIILPLLVYSGYRSGLEELKKKRTEQAQNAYTGFVTKFALLLAAGVPVRQIFYRLEEEYSLKYGADHSLSVELKRTRQELENGYSEGVVYETFGRRMKLLQYQRMAGLLGQNVTRGMQGIRELLLQEAREVMEEERANIRVKGEQAGSKLLLPMMGLLLLVFGVLLVPAFQTF